MVYQFFPHQFVTNIFGTVRMNREQMVRFTLFVLKSSEVARAHGALRFEAEDLVDRWLAGGCDVRF